MACSALGADAGSASEKRFCAVPAAPGLQPAGTEHDKNNSLLKWLELP